MQIDVLRPVTVYDSDAGATAIPSGTLASVTADDSDATYVRWTGTGSFSNWFVAVPAHTPPLDHQRHSIRVRSRVRTDTGTADLDLALGIATGGGGFSSNSYGVSVTDTFQELAGFWNSNPAWELDTASALSGLIAGTWNNENLSGGATETRISELYIDIDCRAEPDFSPEVRDDAGIDRAGGTVTDTTKPTLYFGEVAYDGLGARDWSVTVTGADGVVFSADGSGTPPPTIPITTGLDNGTYTAEFVVSSTVRDDDAFPNTLVLLFDLANVVPPPSPPLLEVRPAYGGYELSWSFPGGLPWNDNYVIAEVWRDDCTGSQRIAAMTNSLNGTYLDLAIPQLDPQPTGSDCEDEAEACDITYRVRYWGYVSDQVEVPETVPVDLILGWPGSVGTIPDGWTRVTELDGYYPRGALTDDDPTITGGNPTHTHTAPAHTHLQYGHTHAYQSMSGSGASTQTERRNGADISVVNQSHTHTIPKDTQRSANITTGATAPNVQAADNGPQARDVIWIRSDGTETEFPVGVLGWTTENVSGWTPDVPSAGRYLRGAGTGQPGGTNSGASSHSHVVDSHVHTVPLHDHGGGYTGLSGPAAASEAETGGTNPRWLGRHYHPINPIAITGPNLHGNVAFNTSNQGVEPPNRRLKVMRNVDGGIQTRIIGLFLDDVPSLDPAMTWCNGQNGTPDMRGFFCRDPSVFSVNSTGGSNTHNHSMPSHTHLSQVHSHEVTIGASTNQNYGRDTSGSQGSVPLASHTHDALDTEVYRPSVSTNGAGNVSPANHIPVYHDVHFVRIDGTVDGGVLPIPELKVTDFAATTVPAMLHGDGLDRLSSFTTRLAVATDRTHAYPRMVDDSTPLDGGLHTVATTEPGEDLALSIAVQGKTGIDELEVLLTSDRVYYSPVGGVPGWFAPAGWTVASPAPDVWVLNVTMVRQPWPAAVDPEELL